MNQVFKSEFAWKKFKFNIPTDVGDTFSLTKSWILPPWCLAVLRAVMALFCVTIMIIKGVRPGDEKWFIFLTNWSFFFLTIAMVGLCLVSIIHLFDQPTHEIQEATESAERMQEIQEATESAGRLKWYHQVTWLFLVIGSNSAIIVTLLYWTLIFTPPTDFMDIVVHVLNTVVVFIELFIDSVPVHVLHVVYAMMVSVIYSIFIVVYWAVGNSYIYKQLDLENGNRGGVVAILLISTLVIIPLVQLLLYSFHRLRYYFSSHRRRASSHNVELNSTNLLPT